MINETNGNRERFSLVLFLILVTTDFKPGWLYKNYTPAFHQFTPAFDENTPAFSQKMPGILFLASDMAVNTF